MDYHTVYKGPEGETTQWDDIQRKLGNLPAKVRAAADCRQAGGPPRPPCSPPPEPPPPPPPAPCPKLTTPLHSH